MPGVSFTRDAGNTIRCTLSIMSAYSSRRNLMPRWEDWREPLFKASSILSADQGAVFIMAGVPDFWNLPSKCAAGCGNSFTLGFRSPLPLTEVTKLAQAVEALKATIDFSTYTSRRSRGYFTQGACPHGPLGFFRMVTLNNRANLCPGQTGLRVWNFVVMVQGPDFHE